MEAHLKSPHIPYFPEYNSLLKKGHVVCKNISNSVTCKSHVSNLDATFSSQRPRFLNNQETKHNQTVKVCC